jgi:hypothetical protein
MAEIREQAWPADWMPAFLLALKNSANVRASCQSAGISRKEAYKRRGNSARFREAWDEALDDALDVLEAVAFQRAKTSSDFLLWKLLASRRREIYGDRQAVELAGESGSPLTFTIAIDRKGDDDASDS